MNKLSVSLFFLVVASTLMLTPVRTEEFRKIDWTVEINTEEVPYFLNYPGSSLRPIIKAAVSYRATGGDTAGKREAYEDLWYKEGTPIGCRRKHRLELRSGDQVAIRVKHRSGHAGAAEVEAASNAIVRIFLDCYLNGNPVTAVIIPDAVFQQVVHNLHKDNFDVAPPSRPDEPVYAASMLHLQSDSGRQSQTMHFQSQTGESD